MSFLNRLKSKGVEINSPVTKRATTLKSSTPKDVDELLLDVMQTKDSVIIYAQVAGSDIEDVSISVEGDADIVLIEGRRIRPEHIAFDRNKSEGKYFIEECTWGKFYRRVILPESIDLDKAEAKIKNGVLVLVLPLAVVTKKRKK